MDRNILENSHRRYNPLNGEWVLVSPHRTKRPWQGKVEKPGSPEQLKYDPKCYLCPGNERAGGAKTPEYTDTYSFLNDFSALLQDTPDAEYTDGSLFQAKSERGICKVLCFSPRHDLTLALMENEGIKKVVDLWVKEYTELGSNDFINYVQIFENRGAIMGCSNPHPHGQIWSNEHIPVLPQKEQDRQKEYRAATGKVLLMDYLEMELMKKERIVFENDHFVALVPFWAVWPYETMVLPKSHMPTINEMNENQRMSLADMLHRMGIRFDNIFSTMFPYSMGIHQAPTDGGDHDYWQFHLHYFPPLLRSATVQKFMVGYELMANPQRDITAEMSAEKLRSMPEVHYTRDL